MKVLKPISRPPPTEEPEKYRVKKFGVVESEDHQIFVVSSTLKRIVEYSRTNMHRELGGVMIGGYYTWKGRRFVEIEDYIEASKGESRSASFKFTAESWSEIGKVREAKFGDKPLVGWHHTHPSFGIFLSGMDLFIHEQFFNLDWQIALVVDPVADKLGFFQWKNKAIHKVGFFTIAPPSPA